MPHRKRGHLIFRCGGRCRPCRPVVRVPPEERPGIGAGGRHRAPATRKTARDPRLPVRRCAGSFGVCALARTSVRPTPAYHLIVPRAGAPCPVNPNPFNPKPRHRQPRIPAPQGAERQPVRAEIQPINSAHHEVGRVRVWVWVCDPWFSTEVGQAAWLALGTSMSGILRAWRVAAGKPGDWKTELDRSSGETSKRLAGNRYRCVHGAVSFMPLVGNGGDVLLPRAIHPPPAHGPASAFWRHHGTAGECGTGSACCPSSSRVSWRTSPSSSRVSRCTSRSDFTSSIVSLRSGSASLAL